MIPKIIHYCWFGRNEKPLEVKKCINSWKKILPDYQIVEWNEENFDISNNLYAEEAYRDRKYAFVSDVARVYALINLGGIYLDTDVEVYRSFDEILEKHCVFGFEYKNWIATSFMAAEKGHPLMLEFFSQYQRIEFNINSTELNMETNVQKITRILEEKGLIRNNSYQELADDIVVYPKEYFSPYDYGNCVLEKTEKSICVHHFLVSWLPWQEQVKKKGKKLLVKFIGKNNLVKLRNKMRHQNEVE